MASERMRYRLLQPNDADAELLFALDQDPHVMKFITNGVPTSKYDIHNIFLPRLNSYTSEDKGWGMWGCFSLVNNTFLGWVLVRPMDFFSANPQFNNIELGWRFTRNTWGKGLATEAAFSVKQALEKSGVCHFSAIAVEQNYASIAIMKKLGMVFLHSKLHKDPLGDAQADTYTVTVT